MAANNLLGAALNASLCASWRPRLLPRGIRRNHPGKIRTPRRSIRKDAKLNTPQIGDLDVILRKRRSLDHEERGLRQLTTSLFVTSRLLIRGPKKATSVACGRTYPATLAPNVGLLRPGRDTEGLFKLHWSHQQRRGQPPQHQLPLNGSDGQRRSGEAAQRPPPATVCR
ncbi:unnamed protein product [Merluccius merluccius]